MTKLSWNKFEPLFGSWASKLEPFFSSGGFDPIFQTMRGIKERGRKIAPVDANLLFRCFRETPIKNLKVVICGMSPYHTMKNNVMIADGLAMSCSITKELQPSLINFYGAAEKELVEKKERDSVFRDPDLKYLADQGVLLFNSSLSTELFKANSLSETWKPFTTYMFEEIFSIEGIPVWFLGKDAAKYSRYLAPFQWSFTTEHPAAASYRGSSDWNADGTFQKISNVVKDMNGTKIEWLQKLPF